ncbi:FtsX-like permease family protein [Streptomyces sp. SL13]|uniref:FtsX-like permease family protein n=1 Tax=Streptantibioticus silvisoli TaxID=2705255 RepID=A0AA90HA60_9ACTN|nr:FtsX-like permease family protein [Streptantibioticus silvisoli]MDI5974101.1 FtsX-like permease family protein [Streptantibioticus silvisoli]
MTVWKTSLRNFFAHKGRMALSAVAVILSVMFVCGTLVFTDTVNATFDKLFDSTAADLTVSPKHQPADGQGARAATLPASVLHTVAGEPGVKSARGNVEITTVTVVDPRGDKNIGPTSGAPTIADSWGGHNPRPSMTITSGHAPHGAGQAMLDADTAKRAHLTLGDTIKLLAPDGTYTHTLSGIATFRTTNPGATLVFLDVPTAQHELLGTTGRFTSVEAFGDGSRSNAVLKKQTLAALGSRYTAQTRAQAAAANKSDLGGFLNVMKYFMLGFAGIAVLVGVFLIVNTFSMLVAQRTREIGLMRALGSSRRQVNRSVLIEAFLLGVFGSLIGIVLGLGLAVGLMNLMNAVGMHLDTSQITFRWRTPVIGAVVGILVTLVSAYLPARRAGAVSPMAAMRDSGGPSTARSTVLRSIAGLIVTVIGAAALVAGARSAKLGSGGLLLGGGVLLTLVGFVVIGPLLAAGVIRVLGVLLRPFGPVGRMAQRNALRNPRRTGATAAALMIGLALVAGLSVVSASLVASGTQQIDKSVGADFVVSTTVGSFNQQMVDAVKKTGGLGHVTEIKALPAVLDHGGKKTDMALTATDPTFTDDLRLPVTAGDPDAAYHGAGISLAQAFADKNHLEVGDTVDVTFQQGGHTAALRVGAVISKNSALAGPDNYISMATARADVPAGVMPQDVELLAAAASHADTDHVFTALKAALHPYPQADVHDQAGFKKELRDQTSQLLDVVYALLALAIIVAVLGVVNTLALSVVERTREIGLLRAIGLSRRQMRRMIRLESVVIALFGAVIGLVLGMAWGIAAQKLLALNGLNVLAIPWSTIVTVFIGAAVVGLLAALAPAWRAARMNVLNAIATD